MNKKTLPLKIILLTTLFLTVNVNAGNFGWVPVTGNEHNMITFGKIHIQNVDFSKSDYSIASFGPKGDADCRSVSDIRPDGSFYATIRGSASGEFLSFKVLNKNSGEVFELDKKVLFKADGILSAITLE